MTPAAEKTGVEQTIDELVKVGHQAASKHQLNYPALVRAFNKALGQINETNRQNNSPCST